MLKFIYFIIIAYLLYRLVKAFFQQGKKYHEMKQEGIIDEMVQDPVCKTYIPRREAFKKTFDGKDILFCSKECADKFEFGKRNS
jgi:YHS domain-containing protein